MKLHSKTIFHFLAHIVSILQVYIHIGIRQNKSCQNLFAFKLEQGTEEEAAALMGASGFTIFRKVTFPHIKWALLYGVVLCTARAMGEFGAVSVLSGHLRGKTNTLPLQVEILFGDNKYVPAFAVASILVILAVIILIIRSIVEYKGKKAE